MPNAMSDGRRQHQMEKLPIDIYDMRDECRREVDARCRYYADGVRHRAISRTTADRRIAIMEALVDLLDKLIIEWEERSGQRPTLDKRHDA